MVRIAVLGVRRIGKMHAENIADHLRARLAGVYDVIEQAAQDVTRKLGVRGFGSMDEVLASPTVDAILIATSWKRPSRRASPRSARSPST